MSGRKLWDSTLDTGIEELDTQHRYLVDLCDRLSVAAVDNQASLLTEIRAYAQFHFSSEEALMTAYAYPGAEHQHQEHAKLLEQLDHLIGKEPDKVADAVYAWFIGHTRGEDLPLGAHIRLQRGD